MPVDPTLLVIYTIALASATRLITGIDSLTNWLPGRIEQFFNWAQNETIEHFDDRPKTLGWFVIKTVSFGCDFFTKMLTCHWCASFWLAVPILLAHEYWANPVMLFIALALAMRLVAGTLVEIGR